VEYRSEGFIRRLDDVADDGDVPPRTLIKGRSTGIVHPRASRSTERREWIAPDACGTGFHFLKPEIFNGRAPGFQ